MEPQERPKWYRIGSHDLRILDPDSDTVDAILEDIEEHVRARLAPREVAARGSVL